MLVLGYGNRLEWPSCDCTAAEEVTESNARETTVAMIYDDSVAAGDQIVDVLEIPGVGNSTVCVHICTQTLAPQTLAPQTHELAEVTTETQDMIMNIHTL